MKKFITHRALSIVVWALLTGINYIFNSILTFLLLGVIWLFLMNTSIEFKEPPTISEWWTAWAIISLVYSQFVAIVMTVVDLISMHAIFSL